MLMSSMIITRAAYVAMKRPALASRVAKTSHTSTRASPSSHEGASDQVNAGSVAGGTGLVGLAGGTVLVRLRALRLGQSRACFRRARDVQS